MCLSACANGSGPESDDRRSASTVHRRMPLAQLRELAGICLSFSMDVPSVAGASSGRPAAGVYAGGRRGAEDANNRRVLMLQALPAVLGACCAVAEVEEEEEEEEEEGNDDGTDEDDEDHYDQRSGSDSAQAEEEVDQPMVEKGKRGRVGRAPIATVATVATAAAAQKKSKGKGKPGGGTDGQRWRSHSDHADGSLRQGARSIPPSIVADSSGGWSRGGLPARGEAIVRDVTDALLDRPWPLRLVLPLLVVFEEVYGLVELLDCSARQPVTESAGRRTARKGSVWARARSRLMETVRMGGLEGADFTGVVRQARIHDIGRADVAVTR